MIVLRILIVVALQTLALGYMIVDRQSMLDSARVVTLKVVPVDPRDIFRGDYVILNYDISRIDVHKVDGDDKFSGGEIAYVSLAKQGDVWAAVAIKKDRPLQIANTVALRAVVGYADNVDATGQVSNVTLTYGIESYFVPQGTGHAIEDEARKGVLSVDVAVDPQGRGAIKALRRAGQVFYVEGVF